MFLLVRDEDDVVDDIGDITLVLGLSGIKCDFLCLSFNTTQEFLMNNYVQTLVLRITSFIKSPHPPAVHS